MKIDNISVGEKVKIRQVQCLPRSEINGTTGVVLELNLKDRQVKVRFDRNGAERWINPDRLCQPDGKTTDFATLPRGTVLNWRKQGKAYPLVVRFVQVTPGGVMISDSEQRLHIVPASSLYRGK